MLNLGNGRKLMRLFRYPVLLLAYLFLLVNDGCGTDKLPDSSIVAEYDADHSVTLNR
jgi:hypothetical protein